MYINTIEMTIVTSEQAQAFARKEAVKALKNAELWKDCDFDDSESIASRARRIIANARLEALTFYERIETSEIDESSVRDFWTRRAISRGAIYYDRRNRCYATVDYYDDLIDRELINRVTDERDISDYIDEINDAEAAAQHVIDLHLVLIENDENFESIEYLVETGRFETLGLPDVFNTKGL